MGWNYLHRWSLGMDKYPMLGLNLNHDNKSGPRWQRNNTIVNMNMLYTQGKKWWHNKTQTDQTNIGVYVMGYIKLYMWAHIHIYYIYIYMCVCVCVYIYIWLDNNEYIEMLMLNWYHQLCCCPLLTNSRRRAPSVRVSFVSCVIPHGDYPFQRAFLWKPHIGPGFFYNRPCICALCFFTSHNRLIGSNNKIGRDFYTGWWHSYETRISFNGRLTQA